MRLIRRGAPKTPANQQAALSIAVSLQRRSSSDQVAADRPYRPYRKHHTDNYTSDHVLVVICSPLITESQDRTQIARLGVGLPCSALNTPWSPECRVPERFELLARGSPLFGSLAPWSDPSSSLATGKKLTITPAVVVSLDSGSKQSNPRTVRVFRPPITRTTHAHLHALLVSLARLSVIGSRTSRNIRNPADTIPYPSRRTALDRRRTRDP